jgi:glycosyltransferase involved in cell wall biosynthesis
MFAGATCMVLASLPAALKPYHLLDRPRIFWEEQFGMVIPEALAAGLPVIASRCGAIPEVLGSEGAYFPPGDWFALATRLAEGPLSRPPDTRAVYDPRLIESFSNREAGRRLTDAYRGLLRSSSEHT